MGVFLAWAGIKQQEELLSHENQWSVDGPSAAYGARSSQEPRPTCWWKWVGRTKGVKSGISTLTVNISAKFQCFHQSGAFFGTAHAWIFRIRWETEKRFTNIVTGAPRVSSPSFARFFPQFRQDLFGFVTYGFLTVHLSDLFHLSIRGVLQLRNVVLMCISKLIKPQINLIYGRYLHQPHCGPAWSTISLHISPILVSMAPYEFGKDSLLFTCFQTHCKLVQKPIKIKSVLWLWRNLFNKLRQCFRASFNHA